MRTYLPLLLLCITKFCFAQTGFRINQNVGGIINTYSPVIALNPCENKITVEDASTFNIGDTVLIIQMKGAVIDTSNTANFGTVTDYKNAGNYEFNYVKSRSGNVVELKNVLTRQYEIPAGKVQLIRVPYYTSAIVTSALTCLAWDGSKGGVLVLNVKDTLTLQSNIDVSGKGFKGGVMNNSKINAFTCGRDEYYYPINTIYAAGKGESIADVGSNKNAGKGAKASGGGGGLDPNTGGGGGGNGNVGGMGGYGYGLCVTTNSRGIGGKPLDYNTVSNKIFMGGAGGAGHCNNGFENPSINTDFNGGNGGGLILITSDYIAGNNRNIISNGDKAYELTAPGFLAHDGMGGGGAGGTVLINNNTYLSNVNVNVSGGKGGDMSSSPTGGIVGPGGGGAGGVVWVNQNTLPANVIVTNSAGNGGVIIQNNNNPYGATAGNPGANIFNLKFPVDGIPFKKNIDSVKITSGTTACNSYNFNGLAYTNANPVAVWQWFFGDGATANNQNASHVYAASGAYTVKLVVTDVNGCKDSISVNIVSSGVNFDFSYKQDICNPLSVQFYDAGSGATNTFWSFGDGTSSAGNPNTVHTYTAPGNYLVKYTIQNGCTDTVVKIISINTLLENIITTPDTTICFGTTKQLSSLPSLNFCWTPTTWLNDPASANPVTSTPQNITYYLNAEITGASLILNGDFSNGNTGFTSAYSYATSNITEGQYFVGTNPQAWNASLSSCKDHTTAGGNMLLVNGSPTPDVNVWKQTITVIPNTNYAFSTWIQALWPPNPAQLQFSINGKTVGNLITASLPTCTWTQFYTTWNSGNSSTAIISIINKNTQVQGNDFALDDISFAPVFIKRDSAKITVDKPVIKTNNDTTVCSGVQLQLNTTGAASYTWTPGTGLSNSNISNPVATVSNSSTYIVSGITTNGCIAKDTVAITTHPKPAITKSKDTTVCKSTGIQLFVTGGVSYSWSPVSGLSNPNISNPIASPSATTTYLVTITDANTCAYKDSIKITIKPSPVFSVSPDQSICANDPKQLIASGGNYYLWQPAIYLNDPNIPNPVSTPGITTTYSVTIKDSTCNDSTILKTTLTVLPLPSVIASKTNDVDCSISSSQLSAVGGVQYVWQPSAPLNNSNISNPLATPAVTTLFMVTGVDNKGCKNSDTVTVYVTSTNTGNYNMPNAFSPNNDGLNDCFGLKYWGNVTRLDFSIYNRFGERVFYTTDPAKCWDGRLKGALQELGLYVYIIKAVTACDTVDRKGTFLLVR